MQQLRFSFALLHYGNLEYCALVQEQTLPGSIALKIWSFFTPFVAGSISTLISSFWKWSIQSLIIISPHLFHQNLSEHLREETEGRWTSKNRVLTCNYLKNIFMFCNMNLTKLFIAEILPPRRTYICFQTACLQKMNQRKVLYMFLINLTRGYCWKGLDLLPAHSFQPKMVVWTQSELLVHSNFTHSDQNQSTCDYIPTMVRWQLAKVS